MRLAIPLILLALTIPAAAQPTAPPKDTAITLNNEDIDVIWGALAELPYRRVAPVMTKIKEQWQAQQAKPAAPAAPTDTAK